MKRLIVALFAVATLAVGAGMATNYTMTQGAGTTFGSLVVSAVNYAQQLVCDPTTPTQCAAVSAGGAITELNSAAILTAAQAGTAANGAATPASSIQVGGIGSGATGGLLRANVICDKQATYDASTNGSTKLISGVSGRRIYVCGFIISTGGTATNVKLIEGTKVTNECDTGTGVITPAFQLSTNDRVGMNSPFWNGLGALAVTDDLCINASAGNAVQAIVTYAQQ